MNPSPGNIACLLKQAAKKLHESSHTPHLDAEILLSQVLRQPRSFVYAHPEIVLDSLQCDRFKQLIERRSEGEPLAYITGIKEFWSIALNITKHVLVPRPETELLVELALNYGPDKHPAHLVDLGTGCGAIAVAIAYERPQWKITATDISYETLSIAKSNAQRLKLRNLVFVEGDWYAAVRHQSFNLIISNPPYVCEGDPHLYQPELRYEPRDALIGGEGGLQHIRHLIQRAPRYLLPGGHLILEHGSEQGEAVRKLLSHYGFRGIRTHQDLAGLERASVGRMDE